MNRPNLFKHEKRIKALEQAVARINVCVIWSIAGMPWLLSGLIGLRYILANGGFP